MAIRGCTCGHPGAGCYCPPSNWIDEEKMKDKKRGVVMDATVQKKKEKGTYPDDFFHPKNEDCGHYVMDNRGTIWMVVRDGGMVQTADYAGRVFSAGINWLEKKFGPLIPIDENVERSLRYAHRRNHPELAHPKCMIDKRDE